MDVSTSYLPHIRYRYTLIFSSTDINHRHENVTMIKRIARAPGIFQLVVLATSCKDHLNIDGCFDDEFNIDSAFANARYIEAYMWGAAALFPDESNTIRYGYTAGPMATDEGFNGLTGGGSANVYYGMD